MSKSAYLLLGLVPLVASCASPLAVSDTVGPNHAGKGAMASVGFLRVFSEQQLVSEGFDQGANPGFYQHADYRIYTESGKFMRYVPNIKGEYDTVPRVISLPPGHYVVKSPAADYLVVRVPVLVEPGRVTNVHLDDQWIPPFGTKTSQLVKEPSGSVIGWRADYANKPNEMPAAHSAVGRE